jgi:hypothetical protein
VQEFSIFGNFSNNTFNSALYLRERVIAVGLQLYGYVYQHHHMPWWLPPNQGPDTFPFSFVRAARETPGLDCSDFTSW